MSVRHLLTRIAASIVWVMLFALSSCFVLLVGALALLRPRRAG